MSSEMYNIPSTERKASVDNGDEEAFRGGTSVRVSASPARQYRSLCHGDMPTTPTKWKVSSTDSFGVDFVKNNAPVTVALLGLVFMVVGFLITTTGMSVVKHSNVMPASKPINHVFTANGKAGVGALGVTTQLRHFKWARKEYATSPIPKVDSPFLCSITRVRNEHTKFKSFIKHQLQEGFDLLLFLDDRSSPPLHSDEPRVRIRQVDFSILAEMNRKAGYRVVNPYGLSFVKQYVQSELMDCTWVAYVDVDEFVTTRRNENKTVRDELNDSFSHVDSVHVPWIFYGNELANAPPVRDDLTLEILWRQNHSLHHEGYDRKTRDRYHEIETKAIFRPKRCTMESDHTVKCKKQVDAVYRKPVTMLGSRFFGYHEEHIAESYLAINHYRFIDQADIRNKCHKDTAFIEYKIGNCFDVMIQSNKPEIFDEIMVRKFFFRHPSENSLPMLTVGQDETSSSAAISTLTDINGHRGNDCIINVHGFHSSRVSYVGSVISDLFSGRASMHDFQNARNRFNEGQHAQTVYKVFRERTVDRCAFDESQMHAGDAYDILYTCERNLMRVTPDTSRQLLVEWYAAWDAQKPIKIQTTPTYDVLFLEQMMDSSHVLVMRHPSTVFNNIPAKRNDVLFAIDTWVRTWDRLLKRIRDGLVKRWVIVQLESRPDTMKLREWTTDVCVRALQGLGSAEMSQASVGPGEKGAPDERVHIIEDIEASALLRAVEDVWQDVMQRWFAYSFRNDTAASEYLSAHHDMQGSVPFVWSSHIDSMPLSNSAFWKDWNLAMGRHADLNISGEEKS